METKMNKFLAVFVAILVLSVLAVSFVAADPVPKSREDAMLHPWGGDDALFVINERICQVWVIDDPEGYTGHWEEQVCSYISPESLTSFD